MVFWSYLLRCSDGSYYAGHTDTLETRTAAHETGQGGKYTRSRLPMALVWSQEFSTREEALAAEMQIKGWSRAKKEALISGDWALLRSLAASRTPRPSTSSGRTGVSDRPPPGRAGELVEARGVQGS